VGSSIGVTLAQLKNGFMKKLADALIKCMWRPAREPHIDQIKGFVALEAVFIGAFTRSPDWGSRDPASVN